MMSIFANNRNLLKDTNTKIVYSAKGSNGIYHLYISDNVNTYRKLKTVFDNDVITPCFSPDGEDILFAEYDGNAFQLVCTNLPTGITKKLTSENYDNYAPTWSLDKKKIAWCRSPKMSMEQADKAEIFVSDWPNFAEKQLTINNRMDAYPVFTSNGNSVLVESGNVDQFFGIFKIDMNGNEEALIYDPLKSGNGIPHVYNNLMVFERTSVLPNYFDIFIFNLETKRLMQKTYWSTPCNISPRFSPDGSKIVCYRINPLGKHEILILFFSEKNNGAVKTIKKPKFLSLPRWNRNGSLLAAQDCQNKQLIILDINGNYNRLSLPGIYRTQRFMEIYNFDLY